MGRHTVRIISRQCSQKRRYPNEGNATGAINKIRRERKKRLSAYYCIYCAGWHLTSKEVVNG